MDFKFVSSWPLKGSVTFLILNRTRNMSLLHPHSNLPVSLRGVSHGRWHAPVTWKLPESFICGNRSTCNHNTVVSVEFLEGEFFISH